MQGKSCLSNYVTGGSGLSFVIAVTIISLVLQMLGHEAFMSGQYWKTNVFYFPYCYPHSSLNAACTRQLGNKRLLYLIFLGKGMVGSERFKRKEPSCNEMDQASRQGRLSSRHKCPQQPSVLSIFVILFLLHPALWHLKSVWVCVCVCLWVYICVL